MKDRVFCYRDYLQVLLIASLVSYVWLFPEHSISKAFKNVIFPKVPGNAFALLRPPFQVKLVAKKQDAGMDS